MVNKPKVALWLGWQTEGDNVDQQLVGYLASVLHAVRWIRTHARFCPMLISILNHRSCYNTDTCRNKRTELTKKSSSGIFMDVNSKLQLIAKLLIVRCYPYEKS